MIGAWVGGLSVNVTTSDFMYGLRYEFIPFFVNYAIIKTLAFAFIVSSLSSYFGYYTNGGAVAVGKSSTEAVVYSSIIILVFNFILTKIILA
jgi:phospholipid/cholesterol/gamma-HCH transport system permease protein|tara:strand:- start:293 stop:568 length:276 start_codon:yes stop_codon:yes gene_type:complete